MSEDEVAGWHHQCSERELGPTWEMVRDREACRRAAKSRTRLSD